MPQTDKEAQQNPMTMQKYAQWFKYGGKALIGTGLASTGLLLGAVGVSTGLEEHNPQHPNIEHAASLITYCLCGITPTAFILGAFMLNYANKLLKSLPSQEPQSPAVEVDKSQQATSSSNVDQSKQCEEDRFLELPHPI
ncbi:MAG: hypothetical protein AMJ43_05295 [Coxiella sp. DG_40]|nr:MAG: hypothetical protein AMJ43_05295 [Coxiella sp. DG_40]